MCFIFVGVDIFVFFFTLYIFVELIFIFFFLKQKTAYEMRIRDWSSDVCSADLASEKPVQCRILYHGFEALEEDHREGKGWEEHARRDGDGTCPSACDITRESREYDKRRRQDARKSDTIEKRAIGEPAPPNGVGSDIGNGRISAPEGQHAALQPCREERERRDRPARASGGDRLKRVGCRNDETQCHRSEGDKHGDRPPFRYRIDQPASQKRYPE